MVGCRNYKAPQVPDSNPNSPDHEKALALIDPVNPEARTGEGSDPAGDASRFNSREAREGREDQKTANSAKQKKSSSSSNQQSSPEPGKSKGKMDEGNKKGEKSPSNLGSKNSHASSTQTAGQNDSTDSKDSKRNMIGKLFDKAKNKLTKKKKKNSTEAGNEQQNENKADKIQRIKSESNVKDKKTEETKGSDAADHKIKRVYSQTDINTSQVKEDPDRGGSTGNGSPRKKKFKLIKLKNKNKKDSAQTHDDELVNENLEGGTLSTSTSKQQPKQKEAMTEPQKSEMPINIMRKGFENLRGSKSSLSLSHIPYQRKKLGPSKLRPTREAEDVLGSKRKKGNKRNLKNSNQAFVPEEAVAGSVSKSADSETSTLIVEELRDSEEDAEKSEQKEEIPVSPKIGKRKSPMLKDFKNHRAISSFSELPVEKKEERDSSKVKKSREAEDVDELKKDKQYLKSMISPRKLVAKLRKGKGAIEITETTRQEEILESTIIGNNLEKSKANVAENEDSKDLATSVVTVEQLSSDEENVEKSEQKDEILASPKVEKRKSRILALGEFRNRRATSSFSELPVGREERDSSKVKKSREAEDVDELKKDKQYLKNMISPRKLVAKLRKGKRALEITETARQEEIPESTTIGNDLKEFEANIAEKKSFKDFAISAITIEQLSGDEENAEKSEQKGKVPASPRVRKRKSKILGKFSRATFSFSELPVGREERDSSKLKKSKEAEDVEIRKKNLVLHEEKFTEDYEFMKKHKKVNRKSKDIEENKLDKNKSKGKSSESTRKEKKGIKKDDSKPEKEKRKKKKEKADKHDADKENKENKLIEDDSQVDGTNVEGEQDDKKIIKKREKAKNKTKEKKKARKEDSQQNDAGKTKKEERESEIKKEKKKKDHTKKAKKDKKRKDKDVENNG
ncbi:MAG: hypothetical protein BGO68_00095 [Candidatus Amoebophilus sp. 36-38]|nr:MAG: hypothetical protein BGO68_00095 [Candidatus Amoebophilus sp. 36-38]